MLTQFRRPKERAHAVSANYPPTMRKGEKYTHIIIVQLLNNVKLCNQDLWRIVSLVLGTTIERRIKTTTLRPAKCCFGRKAV